MTIFEFTPAERASWQRRAAAELVEILGAHRDLPLITWTVGAAGSVLVGRVDSLSDSRARAGFDAWRHALALAEYHEHASDAVTCLSAKEHRNRVRVVLLADLLGNMEGQA